MAAESTWWSPPGAPSRTSSAKDEDYDFDLSIKSKEIPALADFALKIGGDAPMEGQLDENNQITFADGSTLTYYPEAEGQDERFVLTLGQDIHRSERVSLTYTAGWRSGIPPEASTTSIPMWRPI